MQIRTDLCEEEPAVAACSFVQFEFARRGQRRGGGRRRRRRRGAAAAVGRAARPRRPRRGGRDRHRRVGGRVASIVAPVAARVGQHHLKHGGRSLICK